MKFTDTLWDATDSTYQRILSHPFIQGKADGTLPKETFIYYLEQGVPFVAGFKRASLLMPTRAESKGHCDILVSLSDEIHKWEKQVDAALGGAYPVVGNADMNPTCFCYTHNVIATSATKSFEECMVMTLSSTWLYYEVGKAVAANSRSDNPYRVWADHWASNAFGEFTDSLLDIVNTMADNATPERKKAMTQQHATTMSFEEKFWDSCYKKESWGI